MTSAPDSYSHKDNGEVKPNTGPALIGRLDRWAQSTGHVLSQWRQPRLRIQKGGESVYDFGAIHTWNMTHMSGSGSSSRSDEKFAYLYRAHSDGIVMDCNQEDNQLLEYTDCSRNNGKVASQKIANAVHDNDCECEIDTVPSVTTAYGEAGNLWIRGLRLWIQCSDSNRTFQQIGYCNFVPQVEGDKAVDTFDDIMARMNRTPVPGKIVSVITQSVKWGTTGGIDPDRTIWTEHGGTQTRFINFLRVFYVQGPTQRAQIALADFVAKELPKKYKHLARHFETFSKVLDRVREWLLSLPPNYRLVNVQSILVRWEFAHKKKMDPGYINSQEIVFYDGEKHLSFLRYLRVAYIIESPLDGPASRSAVQLGCQLIAPLMIKTPESSHHKDNGEFETQDSTRIRLDQWVQSTGARVISVETVPMRIQEGGESVYGFGAMHTWNKTQTTRRGSGSNSRTKRSDEIFAFFYRVYTDRIVTDYNQGDNRLLEYTLSTRRECP